MKLTKLLAACISAAALVVLGATTAFAGHWQFDGPEKWQWKYVNDDGSLAAPGWQQIEGNWYHLDENSYLDIGTRSFGDNKWYILEDTDESRMGQMRTDIVSPYFGFDADGAIDAYWPERDMNGIVHMYRWDGEHQIDMGILPDGWYKTIYELNSTIPWDVKDYTLPCHGEYLKEGSVPVMSALIWSGCFGEGITMHWEYKADEGLVYVHLDW